MATASSNPKKFKCEHPGCPKAFNRRDYLIRHSANHLEVLPHQCSLCPLRFARVDLLEKHMKTKSHERRKLREQKKQIAEERKVAKKRVVIENRSHDHRPNVKDEPGHASTENPPGPASNGGSSYSDYSDMSQWQDVDGLAHDRSMGGEVYDPRSYPSSNEGHYENHHPHPHPHPQHPQQHPHQGHPPQHAHQQHPHHNPPQPADSLFFTFPARMPDEFGNIDAGNLASTGFDNNVAGGYAWLFGREFLGNSTVTSVAYDVLTDVNDPSNVPATSGTDQLHYESNNNSATHHGVPELIPANGISAAGSTTTSSAPASSLSRSDYLGNQVETNSELLSQYSKRAYPSNPVTQPDDSQAQPATRTVYTKEPKTSFQIPKQHAFGRTFGSSGPPGKGTGHQEYSFVDARTQERVLSFLGEFSLVKANPLYLSPQSLGIYLDYFWSNFDPLYPIIHRATFRPSKAPPLLVLSMVIVGMAYSEDRLTYEIAVEIHRKARLLLLDEATNYPTSPVWILQALLLIDYFALTFAPWHIVEMSEMFHGSHIALLRLSGYLTDLTIPEIPADYNTLDYDAFWRRYIDFESKKRTAFFAFITDTQQAVFYRHMLGLSSFEINLELPCSDSCWEATTSRSFVDIYKIQPRHLQARSRPDIDELVSASEVYQHLSRDNRSETEPVVKDIPIRTQGNWPTLLFSIRRLMLPYNEQESEYPLECFSPYSRLILLHGILNLEWEMQRRGILDIGIISKRRMTEFKTRMVLAVTSWKTYYDRQLKVHNTPDLNRIVTAPASSSGSSPMVDPESNHLNLELNNYSNTFMLCSNWALYHYSLVILYEDTLQLRLFTEIPKSHDNNDGSIRHRRALEYVTNWFHTLDAQWAIWHSMHFMEKILLNPLLIHQADVLPWCTYMAVISFWAYERCRQEICEQNVISRRNYYAVGDDGSIYINEDETRQDATRYLELVKRTPPKSLDDSDFDVSSIDHYSQDSVYRAQLIMAVVAQGYLLLQKFDRSDTIFIPTLRTLLKEYS